jgi:hypothetical protein
VPQNCKSQNRRLISYLQRRQQDYADEATRNSRVSIEKRLAFCESLKRKKKLLWPRVPSRAQLLQPQSGLVPFPSATLRYSPNRSATSSIVTRWSVSSPININRRSSSLTVGHAICFALMSRSTNLGDRRSLIVAIPRNRAYYCKCLVRKPKTRERAARNPLSCDRNWRSLRRSRRFSRRVATRSELRT